MVISDIDYIDVARKFIQWGHPINCQITCKIKLEDINIIPSTKVNQRQIFTIAHDEVSYSKNVS